MTDRAEEPPREPLWVRAVQSRGLRAVLLMLGGGALVMAGLDAVGGPSAIQEKWGLQSILVLLPAQVIAAATPFPSELIAFPMAAIYEFWLGAAVIWCGWVSATPLRYLVVRQFRDDFEIDAHREKLPAWLRRFPVDHPAYLVFGRWLPMGPHLVDYTAGAAGVRLRTLLWSAGVATVLPALAFSAAANGLLR